MSNDGPTYGSEPYQPPAHEPARPMPPMPPTRSGGSSGDAKGFLGALFDFSFTHFVTPMIVKVVYVLATIALVLVWLFMLIAGFNVSGGAGMVVLLLGPIGMILYLALIRMTLEFYVAVVRMSEDIHRRLPGA